MSLCAYSYTSSMNASTIGLNGQGNVPMLQYKHLQRDLIIQDIRLFLQESTDI
jgi:hypothetical protein